MEPTNLPSLCIKCIKSSRSVPNKKCELCEKLKLDEQMFCELNQLVQDISCFECKAYQPLLAVVSKDTGKAEKRLLSKPVKESDIAQYLNSAKFKYNRALALQNPNRVIVNLKYHITWNTACREKLFADDFPESFNYIKESFSKCEDIIGGYAFPAFIAEDHIHVYVESDGEKSIEEIANILKEQSEKAIQEQFTDLLQVSIWDDSYFTETISA